MGEPAWGSESSARLATSRPRKRTAPATSQSARRSRTSNAPSSVSVLRTWCFDMGEMVDPEQARAVMAMIDNPDPSAPIRHRCRCDAEVPTRGDLCPTCIDAELEELRGMALVKARRTLPGLPHAHFGNPEFRPPRVSAELYRAARSWSVSLGGLTL